MTCLSAANTWKLLALIEVAARAGAPAPRLTDLSGGLGLTPPGCISHALKQLARDGAIEIERRGNLRRYRHVAADAWTGWTQKPVRPAHYKKRDKIVTATISKPKPKPVARRPIPCLRCAKPFPSEGKHNRLCVACKQAAGQVSPLALDEYRVRT